MLESATVAGPVGRGASARRRSSSSGSSGLERGRRRVKLTPQASGRVPRLVATLLVARGVRVGRRGRKRQLDLESEYWKLLQSGVGTVAACKLLGIGRKTGYRWRAQNGGLPPGALHHRRRRADPLDGVLRPRVAAGSQAGRPERRAHARPPALLREPAHPARGVGEDRPGRAGARQRRRYARHLQPSVARLGRPNPRGGRLHHGSRQNRHA